MIATCGDGALRTNVDVGVDGYEFCDDGNRADDDACRNDCTLANCGDGVRAPTFICRPGYEACDDGDAEDADECTNVRTVARCGDGIRGLIEPKTHQAMKPVMMLTRMRTTDA